MHRFIESYSSEGSVVLGNKTYPNLTLVEDEDGVGILLLQDMGNVPAHAWTQAHAAGCALLAVQQDDGRWAMLLAERFMDERTEHAPSRSYGLSSVVTWVNIAEPTYRAYRDGHDSWVMLKGAIPPGDDEYVELHAHSEFSALDGLSKVSEMVDQAVAHGQSALAITDHGVCASHPELQRLADKAGIKPIFGLEAYLVDDRLRRPVLPKTPTPDMIQAICAQNNIWMPPDDQKSKHAEAMAKVMEIYEPRYKTEQREVRDYYHLILWAMNDEGLRNIWAASTEANWTGSYYKPRMDWEVLEKFSAGVMASTACLRGPLAYPIHDRQDPEQAEQNLGRLLNIYGDRLYAELHTNHVPEQLVVNQAVIDLAKKHSVPTIAVTDSHYPCHEQHNLHQIWIAVQTNKDLQDENYLFSGGHDHSLQDVATVRKALDYLPEDDVNEAIRNTAVVASRCDAKVEGRTTPPIFSKKGTGPNPTSPESRVQQDLDRLVEMCLSNWHKTAGKQFPIEVYIERFEKEMALLKHRQFCGYYLMWADICDYAKRNRVLVGPGRGSGGGSLVGYLSGITEIDPVDKGLMFERFLTYGRKGLPDFDVDFPASKREFMTQYVIEKYGAECVVRVGTHGRLRNKGAFRSAASVLKNTIDIHWPDIDAISKIIGRAESSTAGKGLSYEDLMVQHEAEFAPYLEKYPLLFEVVEGIVGRLKNYGKHAAGVIISPDESIANRLPAYLRTDNKGGTKDERLISEFAMDDLEALGFVKFDVLTLRTLDTIQMALDLIFEERGIDIKIYEWRDEYLDEAVWQDISNGHTLGMFQVETSDGTRLCKKFKPEHMDHLSDVITLVRPGPMRSGLTDTYFRRKVGQEATTYLHPALEPLLNKSYGCMLYQEDIMAVCQALGGYTLEEADGVRKMLGKKLTELAQGAANEFVERTVAHGVADHGVAKTLGDQMVEFSKYSFNRSHAYAYAMLGYWTGWLKHHYPTQFLTAALSTVDKERIPEFVQEARRLGLKILPPDINLSGKGFKGYEDRGEIRYGLDAISGIGDATLAAITEFQPYASFDDFMERKGAKADSGTIKTLAAVGVFDTIYPNRAALTAMLEWDGSKDSTICQHWSDRPQIVEAGGTTWTLPCAFNWSEEPVELGKTGRPKKRKPPAKRCTRACRNYLAPERPDFSTAEPLTEEQIRNIERDVLGTYLTSTPFDFVLEQLGPAEYIEAFTPGTILEHAPAGNYDVLGLVNKVKLHNDRKNKEMAFLTLFMQDADIEVTCFASTWSTVKDHFRPGQLVVATVKKQNNEETTSGFLLNYAIPI